MKNIFLLLFTQIFFVDFLFAQNNSAIEHDLKNGIINKQEALLQKFYLGFNLSKANLNYRNSLSQTFRKCGTQFMSEYKQNKNLLSQPQINEIDAVLSIEKLFKATAQVYTSPYGKFELTYETIGVNAVPLQDNNQNSIPDYVEKVATYFDYSWKKLIDTMGYLPPPIGAGKYKVSFQNMEYYGYTNVSGSTPKATYIVLHNNFLGFPSNEDPDGNQLGAAKVTAFHEFKHALQIVYNNWNDPGWFLEMDATWAEDIGYDNVNDYYNYLSESHIAKPGRSFENGSGYEDCLWMHYLSQTNGNEINKKIWQRRQVNGFEDIYLCFNNILSSYGKAFTSSLTEYFAYNFLTGDFANYNLLGYEEATKYPSPKLCKSIFDFPSNFIGCDRDQYAAAFLSFIPDETGKKIAITFNADFGKNNFVVISSNKTQANSIELLTSNSSTLNYLSSLRGNDIERLIFIPVNISTGNLNYSFSGRVEFFIPAVFTHKKLKDSESESNRNVITKLKTPFNYALKDSLTLYYSKENQPYSSVRMSATSNPDEYTAVIPAQGSEINVNYFFKTVDLDGNQYYYPESAPDSTFGYYVGKDVVPPVINLSPIELTKSKYNFPQEIFAIVEDNIDVQNVSLEINYANTNSNIEMIKVKDSLFFAIIEIDSSLLNINDKINFKATAVDAALSANTTQFPSDTYLSIDIVEGRKYTSKPNLLIPDLNSVSKRDTIVVNEDINISDCDIYLKITHDRPSDLELRLKTALGNTSYIISRPGLNDNSTVKNLIVTLDNEAFRNFSNPFLINTNQFEGQFKASNLDLSTLSGINAKGYWILLAYDKASGYEGVINEWGLIFRKEKILDIDDHKLVDNFNILSNYPNPFNPSTNIYFSLSRNSNISLKIYNMLGELISVLANNENMQAGNHNFLFDGSKLTSGVYFCQLSSKEFTKTIKLLLLK